MVVSRSALWTLLLAAGWLLPASASGADAPSPLTFEKHVRPILKTHCFPCHGEAGKTKGGLDVRLRRLLVEGGDSGSAIEPPDAEGSYLVQRLRDGEMPPEDIEIRPTEEDIRLIEAWIRAGAKTARREPENVEDVSPFTEEEREHWAFQPLERPAVPAVENADRVRTGIDGFILRSLESRDLQLSPDASRTSLIRRATFDLTGLPPSFEEIDAFLSDTSPDAYERLIDRLLASPHYGEKWARHWLDVAGYADSEGYNDADTGRPYAYKYRDYVVEALNRDKPIDVFVQEQLAGDELIGSRRRQLSAEDQERLIATGFLRMAPDGTSVGNDDQDRSPGTTCWRRR